MAAMTGSLVRAALAAGILLAGWALLVVLDGWVDAARTALLAGGAAALGVLAVRGVAGRRPRPERAVAGGLAVTAATLAGGWDSGWRHAPGLGTAALVGVALVLAVMVLDRLDDVAPRPRSGQQ